MTLIQASAAWAMVPIMLVLFGVSCGTKPWQIGCLYVGVIAMAVFVMLVDPQPSPFGR